MKVRKKRYSSLIVFVVFIRLVFAPVIFISPLLASIINFIFDWSDGEIFKQAYWKRTEYSQVDKILDLYWYCFILMYVLQYNLPGKLIFVSLFVYRTIGFLIYLKTKKEIVFVLFPNFFEIFFFFYLFTNFNKSATSYLDFPKVIYPLAIIIPIVLIREYIVHIKNMNISWFFTGNTTYWIDEKRVKK